jgi:hypothetical protein
MVWRIYSPDRVTGELGVVTVFSAEDTWSVFLSQPRFSRMVDVDQYKAWLESSILDKKGEWFPTPQ